MTSWADDDSDNEEPTLMWKSSEKLVRPPSADAKKAANNVVADAKSKPTAAPAVKSQAPAAMKPTVAPFVPSSTTATTMKPTVAPFVPATVESSAAVVGTCVVMEKAYTRLAGAAKASEVRTVETLQQWFRMLTHKLQRSPKQAPYVLDQLKAIRQDLTVQHIETAFTIEVYNANARFALEHGDEPESRVCFARAAELTARLATAAPAPPAAEAAALRSIFELEPANAGLQALTKLGDGGVEAVSVLSAKVPSDLAACASRITTVPSPPATTMVLIHLRGAGQRGDATAAACASLCTSAMTLNYATFFADYRKAEPLVQKAGKKLHDRLRLDALCVIFHAFSPAIAVDALARELGFATADECVLFLTTQLRGIVFADGSEQQPVANPAARQFVVTKASREFAALQ
jgi:hypothetical protein